MTASNLMATSKKPIQGREISDLLTPRITLRQGRVEDTQAVAHLLATCDMPAALDPCECLLAEDEGRLAGLARIEHADGTAYLRPIAVASAYRGHGVGRRLIEALHTSEDQIRVVARGSAAGFYEALGFLPLDGELVAPVYQAECMACPDLETCGPVALWSRRR